MQQGHLRWAVGSMLSLLCRSLGGLEPSELKPVGGTLGFGFQNFQTCGLLLGQSSNSFSEAMVILTRVERWPSQDWSL